VERFDERSLGSDVAILFETDSFDVPDAVADLPEVDVAERIAVPFLLPARGYLGFASGIDGQIGTSLRRDRLIEGRAPDPSEPLEIALPEPIAERFDVGVGDGLPVVSGSPEQVRCFIGGGPDAAGSDSCRRLNEVLLNDRRGFYALEGPRIELEITAITRSLADINADPDAVSTIVLTPAFFDEYRDRIPWRSGVFVRYAPGVDDAQFESALSRLTPLESLRTVESSSGVIDALNSTASVLANGLLVLAAVAAVAGGVVVGQALVRQAATGRATRTTLRALGATRPSLVADALAPLVLPVVGGVLIGALTAWLTSDLTPIGSMRDAEIDPGRRFDALVLVGGGVAIVAFVFGVAAAAASLASWRSARRRRRSVARAPLLGRTVPSMLGTRFALEPGSGPTAVPLRTAVGGVAVGVAGIIAVAGFSGALARVLDEPLRQGWDWDVALLGSHIDDQDDTTLEQRVAADPDVESTTRLWYGLRAQVDGRSVTGYAQRRVEGSGDIVIVDGRAPSAPDEVALGAKTLRRAGVAIGETVEVGDQRQVVVGQALFPAFEDTFPMADGVLLTDDGMDRLAVRGDVPTWSNAILVRFAPGSDREAVVERLGEVAGGIEPVPPIFVHKEITQLDELEGLPRLLGAFLGVVAILAMMHALVLTVRRRGRDLATARALGCTRTETSRVVAWQATTLALIGAVVGAAAGLLLGRVVWHRMADAYGIAHDIGLPWLALAIALPLIVLVANAVAWLPGRAAARLRPAEALRAE
jgi:hypothetical protein